MPYMDQPILTGNKAHRILGLGGGKKTMGLGFGRRSMRKKSPVEGDDSSGEDESDSGKVGPSGIGDGGEQVKASVVFDIGDDEEAV